MDIYKLVQVAILEWIPREGFIVWSKIFNDQWAHLGMFAGDEQHLECCPQNPVTVQPAPPPID